MAFRFHRALLAGVAASAIIPAWASAQTFVSAGPAPDTGDYLNVGSADQTPNGTVGGAVQAIAADPIDANVLYAASPNGGIFKSVDGGAHWTAQTDNQASLSIASLAFDPTDASYQTLISGVGISSNGAFDNFNRGNIGSRGGEQTGLLYTTDGGQTWSALGGSVLAGQTVDAVAARGSVILAGTSELAFAGGPPDTTQDKGLYRSTNGGQTFTLVSGQAGSGLPPGPVTSIVGDPNNPSKLYAAVTAPDTGSFASTGVYVSTDTGAHWTQIFGAADSGGAIQSSSQTEIKLAVGPNGSLAIGLIDLTTQNIGGLYLSQNSGSSWSQLPAPNTNPGGQATPNFAIAIDPKNPNLVYVSGDNICWIYACANSVAAYRVDATTNTVSFLMDPDLAPQYTSDGSTVHPDSRAIVFDASGRLLLSNDGGIYARTNPQDNTGKWTGLNGNLSAFEAYGVAFDGVGDRLVVSAQDNGSSIQSQPGSPAFNAVGGGDGVNAVVNDRTLPGYSASYTSAQYFGGLQRNIFSASGPYALYVPVTCDRGHDCGTWLSADFLSPIALNKVDPSRIAFATSGVWTSQDTLTGSQGIDATSVDLALSFVGSDPSLYNISALAYGTKDDIEAILVGDYSKNIAIRTSGSPFDLTPLPAYNAAGGAVPTSVAFDLRTDQRFFVADSYKVWGTTDQGATIQDLSPSLPAGFVRPSSLEFISNNGVNALLVGGLNEPLSCTTQPDGCTISSSQSPITVADSDSAGTLSNWRAFGQGLPNAVVNQLNYDQKADVLAVSSVGRGAWLLYDVTSYFPQATVLQFGLANNDSAPDALILTDGVVGHRPLIKYGSGTLTINGDASYTGGTRILGGTLVIGTGGTTGDILGDVVDNGLLVFDRSDIFNFSGVITGSGGVIQAGGGSLLLSANDSYSGGTSILSGALFLGSGGTTGSITGDVVDNGALVFNRSNDFTFAGRITGTGDVIKEGAGAVLMTGDSSFGSTIVGDGELTTTGSVTTTGSTTILGGTLTVKGPYSTPDLTVAAGEVDVAGGDLETTTAEVTGGLLQLDSGIIHASTVSVSSGLLSVAGGTFSAAGLEVSGGFLGGLVELTGGTSTVTDLEVSSGSLFVAGGTLSAGSTTVTDGLVIVTAHNAFTSGVVAVGPDGFFAAPGGSSVAGIATFNNAGRLDIRNDYATNVFTIGAYTGSPGAKLILGADLVHGRADRLAVASAAGSTGILLDQGALTPQALRTNDLTPLPFNPAGIAVVTSASPMSPTTFTLAGGPVTGGLFQFDLAYDAAGQRFVLIGAPTAEAYRLGTLPTAAQSIWFDTMDSWQDHQGELRAAGGVAPPAGGSGAPGVWARAVGHWGDRTQSQTFTAYSNSYTFQTGYNQRTGGFLGGFDKDARILGGEFIAGFGGGYITSSQTFKGASTKVTYEGPTLEASAAYLKDGLFLEGAFKADFLNVSYAAPSLGSYGDPRPTSHLTSYGAYGDVGYRMNLGKAWLEPIASLAYVETGINELRLAGTTDSFGLNEEMRGRFGVSGGATLIQDSHKLIEGAVSGSYWDRLSGGSQATIAGQAGGAVLSITDPQLRRFGEVGVSLTAISLKSGWSGFAKGDYQFGTGFTGEDVKVGVRFRF
jgi:autotransporter-associated beta strand protein